MTMSSDSGDNWPSGSTWILVWRYVYFTKWHPWLAKQNQSTSQLRVPHCQAHHSTKPRQTTIQLNLQSSHVSHSTKPTQPTIPTIHPCLQKQPCQPFNQARQLAIQKSPKTANHASHSTKPTQPTRPAIKPTMLTQLTMPTSHSCPPFNRQFSKTHYPAMPAIPPKPSQTTMPTIHPSPANHAHRSSKRPCLQFS